MQLKDKWKYLEFTKRSPYIMYPEKQRKPFCKEKKKAVECRDLVKEK